MPRIQLTRRSPENRKFAQSSFVSPQTGGGGGSLDFFSDWRTGTGTSQNACCDGTKWNGGFTGGGDGKLTVVATTGLNAPAGMTNCLRANYTRDGDATPDHSASRMINVTSAWAAPVAGSTIYYRIYFRNDIADGATWLGNNSHPIQLGGLSPEMEWLLQYTGGNNGHGESQANSIGLAAYLGNAGQSYPDNYYMAGGWGHGTLPSSLVWNRLEWALTRHATNSTCKLQVRVYNNAGSLTWTNVDFWGDQNHQLSVIDPTLTFSDMTNILCGVNLGNNGPDQQPTGNNYIYWGGFAVSRTDWCGAYPVAGVEG